ncbi:MAG: DNA alkylation repair protein [Nanoarchaeota archaeon]
MSQLMQIKKEIKKAANPEKALLLQRFFKTGKGEYGEGDIFLGITVPESRKIATKFKDLSLQDVESLLQSQIHEERLIALLFLVHNYSLAKKERDEKKKEEIYNFYLKSTKYINNWDLVDLSSHQIIGDYLIEKDKSILYDLAKSKNLWERRIAVISTFYFIKNNKFDDSLNIALLLLKDKHDLIQKAVGWMLREVWKKDSDVLENFLRKNYKNMPRTMLRYAIEHFPESKRKAYLKGGM